MKQTRIVHLCPDNKQSVLNHLTHVDDDFEAKHLGRIYEAIERARLKGALKEGLVKWDPPFRFPSLCVDLLCLRC